jgi:hypothetical protein
MFLGLLTTDRAVARRRMVLSVGTWCATSIQPTERLAPGAPGERTPPATRIPMTPSREAPKGSGS